jgi:hypothetical protein
MVWVFFLLIACLKAPAETASAIFDLDEARQSLDKNEPLRPPNAPEVSNPSARLSFLVATACWLQMTPAIQIQKQSIKSAARAVKQRMIW